MSEKATAVAAPTPAAKPQTPATPTPVAPEVAKKNISFMLGANGAPPPAETDDQKLEREKAEADEKAKKDSEEKAKKDTDEAAKAAAEGKGGTPAPAKAAPAKRIIRKAGVPAAVDDATGKVAEAATKLAEAADKLAAGAGQPAAAAPKVDLVLSEAEQYELAVLRKLEEAFPSKSNYKGIAERAEKYIAEFPAFQAEFDKNFESKWLRANGSKEFNSDEDRDAAFNDARKAAFEKESEKFKEKFNIGTDEADFRRAEIKLETEPAIKELEQAKKKLAEMTEKQRAESLVPIAKEKADAAVADFAAQAATIGDEFKDVIAADGTLDEKKLAEMPDGDIVTEVLTDAAQRARNFAEATALAFSGGETDLIDQVLDFCLSKEQEILSLPPAQQRQDGKQFAPRKVFNKMNAAERAKHWVLDADAVITLANDVILGSAKTRIDAEREKTQARIVRRGLKPAEAAAPAKSAAKPKSPASTDPAPPSTPAPASSGSSFTMDLMRGRVKPT